LGCHSHYRWYRFSWSTLDNYKVSAWVELFAFSMISHAILWPVIGYISGVWLRLVFGFFVSQPQGCENQGTGQEDQKTDAADHQHDASGIGVLQTHIGERFADAFRLGRANADEQKNYGKK
jgi:hypothetical protein